MKHCAIVITVVALLATIVVGAPRRHRRPARPKTSPSVAQSPQPAATPFKSLLDGIAENGSSVTTQLLAPLDAPSIPESTISVWREDLLDEAAKQPAESQAVYKQATHLLDSWQSALRERTKLIADAKVSGRVIETTDMDSSRKSQLHFWDWLAYARERNDARAHQRKASQNAAFFASGPSKIWTDRSAAIQAVIDRQFQHFRALRREALQRPAAGQPQPAN